MDTDTLDAFRGASYEIAEAIAPTWERRRADIEEVAAPVREWMLRELRPQEGDTVLELAAGVGETGFEAAAIVGEHGRLVTSDFSPAMLEAARRRGAELGVANVDYRVMDAERIELADDSVDGVLCRFGYMLMADPAAALAETRRVLRPGGRLTLAVWGAPERNPFFGIIAISLIQRGHIDPPQPPPAPGIFSMASAERTEELLRGAGFGEVRTEEMPGRFVLPDVDEYLSVIADTAGPIALALRGLLESDRAAIKAEVEDSFARFAADGGYELPCVALCAVAR
ncbi:MAG: class I SAM-dependent methyltransferase [Thermoleophilaceae bacterium]